MANTAIKTLPRWRFPGLTSEATGAAVKGNLARESGDGVLAEAFGQAVPPGLTSEATEAAAKGNLARESGDGVLAEALGPTAPRQSEVATSCDEERL
jgi:hypothetical protein